MAQLHHPGYQQRTGLVLSLSAQETSVVQAEERDQETAADAAAERAEREQFEQR